MTVCLYVFPPLLSHPAVIRRNGRIGLAARRQRGPKLFLEVPLGVAVFGDGLYLLAEHPMYAVPLIMVGIALLAWTNRGRNSDGPP